MLLQAFADLERQIQTRVIRIRRFQQLDHTQALPVMVEAAVFSHALREHLFARMSEGRVAEIMRESNRLRQILV